MKLHPRRPSPAMVVACISLFVALGGTSIAAVQLGRNSVGSKHIKNGQVKRVDLARNAVTSAKILDAWLLAKDFATGQLPKGDKGDPGPTAGFRTGNIFADPPSTPESTFIPTESFSLPVAGRLLLLGRVSASILCSMGSFRVDFGLYVDGVPVPGSGVDHDIGGPIDQISLAGVTDPLTPGAHTLAIGFDCVGGSYTGDTRYQDNAITAVLLGS